MYQKLYKCPECGSDKIIYLHREGDSVCSYCGLVIDEKKVVDSRKGLKTGAYRDSYGPTQAPWVPKKDRGSIIVVKKDTADRNITAKKRHQIFRWQKLQRLYGKKKSLVVGLALFRKITKQLSTPENIKLDAIKIFINASEKKLIIGRTYEGIIGSSILIAYRINNHLKSITELSKEISTSRKKILKCYEILIRELKIKVSINFRPEEYVSRFCSEVSADMEIEKKAIEIIKKFRNKVNTLGKDPKGIAVAAIYFVSEMEYEKNPEKYEKITQKELASTGSVTEVTLRNRCKEIKKYYFQSKN